VCVGGKIMMDWLDPWGVGWRSASCDTHSLCVPVRFRVMCDIYCCCACYHCLHHGSLGLGIGRRCRYIGSECGGPIFRIRGWISITTWIQSQSRITSAIETRCGSLPSIIIHISISSSNSSIRQYNKSCCY
jgi:hypothetical protein